MSCFVVSNFDIDILVTAYGDPLGDGDKAARLTWTGRALLAENVKSFAACYRVKGRAKGSDMRNETAHGWRQARAYTFTRRIAHRAAVAKLARFYDYQACEHDGFETSTAKTIVDKLMASHPESLPLYDKMPWGITSVHDLMVAGVPCQVDRQGRVQ
jgi:hypothetical protein